VPDHRNFLPCRNALKGDETAVVSHRPHTIDTVNAAPEICCKLPCGIGFPEKHSDFRVTIAGPAGVVNFETLSLFCNLRIMGATGSTVQASFPADETRPSFLNGMSPDLVV